MQNSLESDQPLESPIPYEDVDESSMGREDEQEQMTV